MPWLDLVLKKNPIRIWLGEHGFISNATSPVTIFAGKRVTERNQSETVKKKVDSIDLLGRFMQEGEKDPELVNDRQIMGLTVSNIFAGSDSTAITFRTIFYYLLRQPETMAKLMAELDQASFDREGGIIGWKEARELPYLTAVVHEALRIFPAVGVPLERVVPAGGLEVCRYFLPAGTIVGASAWTLHRKESIFGDRTEEFRPERWLEGSESQKTLMNNALFTFGIGSRSCIGRNISMLEIYKLVPTMLKKFNVSLPVV
jgi:cytochrome P450